MIIDKSKGNGWSSNSTTELDDLAYFIYLSNNHWMYNSDQDFL